MLLPLAGFVLVALPGLLLGLWFSWLTRRRWLRGGVMLVARTWVVCITSIAGMLTVLGAPVVNTGFGLLYNALVCFCVFFIAGGIPSAVIALVVSCLSYCLRHSDDEYASTSVLIMVLGTFSGILAGLPALKLSMDVMDVFWHS